MISSVYCYRSSTTPRQNTSLFPEFNGNLGSVPPTLPLTVTNLLTSPPRHWAVAPRLAMSQWRKCHTTPLHGGTKLCRNIATPMQLHSGQPYPDSPATSRQRRRCHGQLPAKSPRHNHSIRTSGSQLLSTMASQLTSVSIVYSTVCSSADQRKQQSCVTAGPVNSPHKGPVTGRCFHLMTSSWNRLSLYLQHVSTYLPEWYAPGRK